MFDLTGNVPAGKGRRTRFLHRIPGCQGIQLCDSSDPDL